MANIGGDFMATILENYLVKKKNVLNEIRANGMTLQELRFFTIYLSKINPKDINTRVVRFPISDFQSIMELGRINIRYLKKVTNSLLCKVVNVPTERGGYDGFQLFKKCRVDLDDKGEWYIEIDSHDDALPLLFDYKDRYFSYQLWNALRLKSSNQLRMYELLKQYERIGYRIMSVEDLKKDLGINDKDYDRYNNFKKWVLDGCQQALAESTDIKFTYEPYGKKGQGGKILALKFNISKNMDYVDQLSLSEFIDRDNWRVSNIAEIVCEESENFNTVDTKANKPSFLEFYMEACDDEFTSEQIQVLYDLLIKVVPAPADETDRYDYLRRKYNEMDMRNPKKNRFGYLKKLFELGFQEMPT